MKNALNWFEIPTVDFERAKKFYEAVFQAEMEILTMPEFDQTMAFFPSDQAEGVGGSIVKSPDAKPAQVGSLIYLNGGDDLSKPLGRVEAAGGKIAIPKTTLGPHGFFATFTDTEGNLVGFHSPN
jgi:predicted enzyme related to lactoylglutathione lyase